MIFSTPIFVFAFLPLFLIAYYAVPATRRTAVILVGSCLFYGWWKATLLLLVLGIAAVSFVAGYVSIRAADTKHRQWAVRIGVSINLLCLGWFKYAYFFAGSFEAAMTKLGTFQDPFDLPEIILPIGLSFLVFQSISYILDVSRKDAPPARSLIDFLAFSTLFPQLIAGPILRYKDLADQLTHRSHSLDAFSKGMQRFVVGLAMKLLIADSVAPMADRLFALPDPTMAEAWLAALTYSIQLFFDFAGYSAMAIGLGLMIGFRFVENFNNPYISRSVTEFWQRWHISLSNWLRDYLYIPLGGNRGGGLKTYRNLVLTMVLGGLWHGANWTFVLWGIWHGGLMALERRLGSQSQDPVWPRLLAWPLTMAFVMIGWVMFRAETVAHAINIYKGMLAENGFLLTAETLLLIRPTELLFLAVGVTLTVWPVFDARLRAANLSPVTIPAHQQLRSLTVVALFALCGLIMQARSDSPFLYFQF